MAQVTSAGYSLPPSARIPCCSDHGGPPARGSGLSTANEKYVALTTYRRNGESSATAVWIADLGDGTIGFTTPSSSLKAKRLGRDNRVLLQACDSRGRPKDGSDTVAGTAVVVSGGDFDRVLSKIKAKYGWQVTAVTIGAKIAALVGRDRASDAAVVITLD